MFPTQQNRFHHFMQLFWSPSFAPSTQLHSAQLALSFMAANTGQLTRNAMQQLVAIILVTMHRLPNKAVTTTLFTMLKLIAQMGPPGVPAGILLAFVQRQTAVESSDDHLPRALAELLSPARPDAGKSSEQVTDKDRIQMLEFLTELATDISGGGSEGAVYPIQSLTLLQLIQQPLVAWALAPKPQPALSKLLRTFVTAATGAVSVAPHPFVQRAVQAAFEILARSTSRKDARENLQVVEHVLSNPPPAQDADGAESSLMIWTETLWSSALECVNDVLVPPTDVHMQTRVLRLLLNASVNADVRGATHVRATIVSMPLDAQAVVPCLPDQAQPASDDSDSDDDDDLDMLLGGARKRPSPSEQSSGKRARSDLSAKDRAESHQGLVVLEMLQEKHNFLGTVAVLVAPLFSILRIELEQDSGGDDYTKQLVLSALQWIARADTSKADDTSYDVSILVDCMRGTTNPSTRNHTLVLLSAIAALNPSTVMSKVIPVFTHMGASAVQVEDAYSMSVIQQILRTIVPPVLREGGGTAIRDLVQVLIDAMPATPSHRRIPLFESLVSVLKAPTHLHGVVFQLLKAELFAAVKPQSKKKADKRAPVPVTMHGIEIQTLSHELTAQFSAAEQLLCFSHLIDVLMCGTFSENQVDESTQGLRNPYTVAISESFAAIDQQQQLALSLSVVKFGHTHLSDKTFLKKVLRENAERGMRKFAMALFLSTLCCVSTAQIPAICSLSVRCDRSGRRFGGVADVRPGLLAAVQVPAGVPAPRDRAAAPACDKRG